jgi:dihydrodipicolinate synthase/N-acetylneuraminate lyase
LITLSGVLPIAPTAFSDDGELDLPSQRRATEFMLAAGSDAVCILANFSEQFSLSDRERDELVDVSLDVVAGRVPVIVTASHFSTRITAERCRRAAAAGASAIMLMPPYHGATIRPGDQGIRAYFEEVAESTDLPIIIQDSPVSGTHLSVDTPHHLTETVPSISYLKLETADATSKLLDVMALGRIGVLGPFDGEEGVNVMPDLDVGITGAMTSAMIPDIIGTIVRLYRSGDRPAARALYEHWLPLILFENRQCGLRATKVLMHEAGTMSSEATRHPLPALHPRIRHGLLELARRFDPLILRWAPPRS